MAKKKDFSVGGPAPAPVIPIIVGKAGNIARSAKVSIPLSDGRLHEADFSSCLGLGFDDTVFAIVGVVAAMVTAGQPRPLTLQTIVNNGLVNWWQFCRELAEQGNPPALASINRSLMEAYVGWLSMRMKPNGERWAKNTARTAFSKTKTVLAELVRRKLLLAPKIFPPNPFPGATRLQNRRRYIRPLSDGERERLLQPLALEVSQVFDGTHPGSLLTRLGLCVFAVFLKAGVNATPFLEIPRDLSLCFLDHPRVNRKILVTFKPRARAYTKTPLETSKTKVVSLDVYKLCQRVTELTKDEAAAAEGTSLARKLWLYRQKDGKLRSLSTQELSTVANAFTKRHKLLRDDGTLLKMSSQLFRNTRLNRIWRASKGDLLATAKSASNTPAAAERYLTVTPDLLEEHRLAGEVLVATLSKGASYEATPHSGCRDTFNGELAPKMGNTVLTSFRAFAANLK